MFGVSAGLVSALASLAPLLFSFCRKIKRAAPKTNTLINVRRNPFFLLLERVAFILCTVLVVDGSVEATRKNLRYH